MTDATTPYDHFTTREQFITEAAKHEIKLESGDITGSEPDGLRIDDMPAAQWLDAMTME